MNADLYAHALHGSLADSKDAEKCVSNLVSILKERGHYRLLPEILSSYMKLEETGTVKKPTLVVSKESDKNVFKDVVESYKQEFNITDVEMVVDDTLVGGYILRTGDKTIDNSYKRSLLNLYRLITA